MNPTIRLIVGLGNPTSTYTHTRHNVGREFVDALAAEFRSSFSKKRQGEVVRLPAALQAGLPTFAAVKLRSFMNESGPVLKKVMDSEGIDPSQILIVVDDFMIPFGTLRLRSHGSAGGHNGLKSIIETLGTEDFPRLRVGVGPVPTGEDPADFVLEKFTKAEQNQLLRIFGLIKSGIETLVTDGFQKAMTVTNKAHI